MNYRQAEDYILNFTDYEKIPGSHYTSANYDLRRVEALLKRLGTPHFMAKTIHVAGTNGKGSTAAMVAEVLSTSGYKTGLFTSPHLHTLRERIKVNGGLISEEEFANLVSELQPEIEAINYKVPYGRPTTFEVLTALAFAYFRKKRADFQVLEVGLGGRLDATNVARPEVCIITSISLDHTQVLGDTLAGIAAEKVGIIKPGCIVVSAPQFPEVSKVISEACHRQGAKLLQVAEEVTWHKVSADLYQQSFIVGGKLGNYKLTIPLLGDHQLENAVTAVTALEILASSGVKVATGDISRGLARVSWPGRLQVLSRQPMVVVDGAHNAHAVARLREAIRGYFDYARCLLIFGASCDKDIAGMVKELASFSSQVIATRSSHPRAASPSVIAAEFIKRGIEAKVAENVFDALSQTVAMAEKTDLICVTGSLFVVAEALDYATKYLEVS